jgi:cytochrome c oxidase assembly protein subunit 11
MVCQAIDPGGSSSQNGQTEAYQDVEVDESREVVVQFATNVERQLPWELTSVESAVRVHPGEKKNASFTVRNIDTAHEITGKAVYDINPPEAGAYFKKVECFCFTEQTLGPGEEAEMPLVFWFDPDLPDHIRRITVAYTFFAADSSRERAQRRSKTAEVR